MDDASEINPMSPVQNQHHSNGTSSPRENGLIMKKMEHNDRGIGGPHSPRSGTSSNASTPSAKKMEEKPSTPIAKSVTPTNGVPPPGGAPQQPNGLGGGVVKAVAKPPILNPGYPHYHLPMNGGPHELQAAAVAAYGAAGVHNNLPPGLNNYPRPPLQVGFDPHAQMRAPLGPGMASLASGGKP